MASGTCNENVFVNCPFDAGYKSMFNALVFTVFDCGFVPHCALEEDDGSRITVQKIYDIIQSKRSETHKLRTGLFGPEK